jgi:hypothetical protein
VNRLLRALIRSGLRNGWRRGVGEGSTAWVIIGGLALLGHLAGRALKRNEETVLRERLAPGDSLRITHLPRP